MSKPLAPAVGNRPQPVKSPFLVRIGDRIEGFNRTLSYFSAVGMILMMIPTIVDVFMRMVLNDQLRGAFEFTGLVMALVIYFGVAYAQTQRAHVRVSFVVDRFPPMFRQATLVCVYFFMLCIFAFVIYATSAEAIYSVRIGEYQPGSTRFPVWPSRILVSFGIIMLSLQFVVDFFKALAGLFQGRVTE